LDFVEIFFETLHKGSCAELARGFPAYFSPTRFRPSLACKFGNKDWRYFWQASWKASWVAKAISCKRTLETFSIFECFSSVTVVAKRTQ
jgi:hypothetical protein